MSGDSGVMRDDGLSHGAPRACSCDESTDVPLTRIEVLDFVGEAFGDRPVDRDLLVRTAAAAGARDVLLRRLRALPPLDFTEPEDLWIQLPDVPEDLQQLS